MVPSRGLRAHNWDHMLADCVMTRCIPMIQLFFFVFIRIYDGFSFVVVYDHYPRIGWHNLLLEDTATSPL
jgi:hypothetical protein